MKNYIKPILILIIISISLGLIACRYFSPLIDYYGVMLKTDDLGHFEENITYKDGNDSYKFMQNGECEYYSESFEGEGEDYDGDGIVAEGWVKTSGEKGTYSWETEWFIVTSIVTHEIDSGEWVEKSNQITYTDYQYFSEHNFCPVWISGYGYEFTPGAENPITGSGWHNMHVTATENGDTETWTKLLEIQEDSGNINYYYRYQNDDSDSHTLRQGEYVTFPDGADFEKAGEVFSLHVNVTNTLYSEAEDSGDDYIMTWNFTAAGPTSIFSGSNYWVEWPEDGLLRGFSPLSHDD